MPDVRFRSAVMPAVLGGLALGLLPLPAAFALAGQAGTGDPLSLSPQRIAELTEFVRQDCGSCHGMTLKGGLGRPLTRQALSDFDVETLSIIILDGIPDTPMPPWRPLFSEREVAWMSRALKEGLIE